MENEQLKRFGALRGKIKYSRCWSRAWKTGRACKVQIYTELCNLLYQHTTGSKSASVVINIYWPQFGLDVSNPQAPEYIQTLPKPDSLDRILSVHYAIQMQFYYCYYIRKTSPCSDRFPHQYVLRLDLRICGMKWHVKY